jgi:hypothetical protein
VTSAALTTAIADYKAGLQAELALLDRLDGLATDQTRATTPPDYPRLQQIAELRRQLLAELLGLDGTVRPLRTILGEHRAEASLLPGFADVSRMHRAASELVQRVLGADRETIEALEKAQAEGREAAQALENGGHTLAAYRKVISPSQFSPALFEQRG